MSRRDKVMGTKIRCYKKNFSRKELIRRNVGSGEGGGEGVFAMNAIY